MLFSVSQYKLFLEALEGSSPGTVWSAMSAKNFGKPDFSYKDKQDYFLEFLELLLKNGRIKLAKHGEFLAGTIDEQLTRFRVAFPETEEELYDGLWFVFEECPGGIVWILESGELYWT
ncbi:DUF596 domain-containing protein [Xenorhabdus ishibashii]|uniref:DUF596 domain-containing protein n=1 Tax=Xenorhabdus ishibashii TaxID=1034471 RepID=A0A2D0KIQ2_9GAMM|nr:DUF596 domain-containing protein [Xenorhabdus ishibashii]PHM63330.1 hypothetical protein Xish_02571 [Xenorhabdus ishibashii]